MNAFDLLRGGTRFDRSKQCKDARFLGTKAKTSISQDLPALDFFSAAGSKNNYQDTTSAETVTIAHRMKEVTEATETSPKGKSIEEINVFRKKHRIRVYGDNICSPIPEFEEMHSHGLLSARVYRNLIKRGLERPTPIQMQAIPAICEGRDVICCAPTGSGKTLSFLLPIIHSHEISGANQKLIITPTRELAKQIYRECCQLVGRDTKVILFSKANLKHKNIKYDIVICTPLRMVHAVRGGFIHLDGVDQIVIDEADKLFEMGFVEQVDEIIAACSTNVCCVQKAIFSATITSHVETLAGSFTKNIIRVVVGQKNAATDLIRQSLLFVGNEEGKLVALRQQILQGIKPPVLIFVESIDRAKELFRELIYDGINVDVIHSERTNTQRDIVIGNFRAGKIWVLIATELLARGIDFKGVNLVINYDIPKSLPSYVHRIGRTGRAGREGEAITYFTRADAPYVRKVAVAIRESGGHVPDWMMSLK